MKLLVLHFISQQPKYSYDIIKAVPNLVRADYKLSMSICKRFIEESIQNYSGNCPCPYHTARNGSRCRKHSAYLRASGAAPLCYPEDVTDRMVKQYKAKA